MKRFICILLIFAFTLTLCSCALSSRRKKGLRNNLKTVDMSKYTQTISNPKTDSRIEKDPAQQNSTGANNPNAADVNVSDPPMANNTPKPNSSPAATPAPSATPGNQNGGGKVKEDLTAAESEIREDTGEMVPERYLIYLPTIIESPLTIERTAYGVTVHFPPTERFDKYVNELIGFGFIQDLSLSESSFSAHTKDGMYVKFIVTAQESWLAIYDDEQHLNG